jgi:2-alkyl-3-oxoalkanoate reductase
MEVFVTGAGGVIGRRVIPLLVRDGHEVTAIGRTRKKREALERAGASAVDVSLFDPDGLRAVVVGHDAVINLATHMPSSSLRALLPGAWSENDRIRSEASDILVDTARAGGVRHFIQESFAPAYPDRGDTWIDEYVPLAPARYNQTLLDAERAAASFAAPVRTSVVLRFAAFYGPDSHYLLDAVRAVRFPGTPAFALGQGLESEASLGQ